MRARAAGHAGLIRYRLVAASAKLWLRFASSTFQAVNPLEDLRGVNVVGVKFQGRFERLHSFLPPMLSFEKVRPQQVNARIIRAWTLARISA